MSVCASSALVLLFLTARRSHEESTDSPIDLDSQDNNELPEEDEDDEDEEVAPAAAGTKRKRAPRHNWTSEEDLYLLRAVAAVGVGNWRHVLQHLLHRNHQYWKWCEVRSKASSAPPNTPRTRTQSSGRAGTS